MDYFGSYGEKKQTLKLTYDMIVGKSQTEHKLEYQKAMGQITNLTKILGEDNQCWVGIEGQGGHWTKLPNNRTLNQHWMDESKLKELKNRYDWMSELDFETSVDQLDETQYYKFLAINEFHLEKECGTCHSILGRTEEFLYLPSLFDCDGFDSGIQLCRNCLKQLQEALRKL